MPETSWYGTFRDPTNEGIHHWSDGDLGNTFALNEGETVCNIHAMGRQLGTG